MARRWTRWVLLGLSALVLIALAAATRIVPPIFGRIVDAATREPVQGVAVTLESTRYHGMGPTETVVHSRATTNRWGWFWLMPAIGWSDSTLVLPSMGEHWLTINQIAANGSGSFSEAEVSILYDPTSARGGLTVSNPAYFPLTVAYGQRKACGLMRAWLATCVDERSWWNITISLMPSFGTPDRCTSVRDSVAQDRCRQVNTYRAAFLHVDTFDEVQRSLALCDQLPIDRIRVTCRDQLGVYVANPEAYGRSAPRADAEPRVAPFFPATIAGEHRVDMVCETAAFVIGLLDCRAKYGDEPHGLVWVTFQEWAGRDEVPLEKRNLFKNKPAYLDAAQAIVTSERRPEGTIRRYRGPTVTAADWISGNRYIRLDSEQGMKKLEGFIEPFLRSFPSTLH